MTGEIPQNKVPHKHTQITTYLSLDQVVPLRPDVFEEPQDVNCALVLYLLQHAVNDNVRPCTTNTSTAERTHTHTPKPQLIHRNHKPVTRRSLKTRTETPSRTRSNVYRKGHRS